MKKVVHKTVLSIFFGTLLVITASPLTAQVYKVVDKDGNVTFTNQAPADARQRFLSADSLALPRTLNPRISPNTERAVMAAIAMQPPSTFG